MFRLRAALAGLVLSVSPLALHAAQDAVTTFTLDNGMQVVVVEDHRAPVLQHMVWYKAGSADEPPARPALRIFWNT